MPLPNILHISWSIHSGHEASDRRPPLSKEVARPSEPEDFLSDHEPNSSNLALRDRTLSAVEGCSTCVAHEITNWLPSPSENSLSASPCSPCLRGYKIDSSTTSTIWNLPTLESFFKTIALPATPIKLNPHSTIHDLPIFISTHLAICNRYKGNREILPYLHRLQALKHILTHLT